MHYIDTMNKVQQVKELLATGMKQKDIAAKLGVHYITIWRYKNILKSQGTEVK